MRRVLLLSLVLLFVMSMSSSSSSSSLCEVGACVGVHIARVSTGIPCTISGRCASPSMLESAVSESDDGGCVSAMCDECESVYMDESSTTPLVYARAMMSSFHHDTSHSIDEPGGAVGNIDDDADNDDDSDVDDVTSAARGEDSGVMSGVVGADDAAVCDARAGVGSVLRMTYASVSVCASSMLHTFALPC